MTLATYPFQQRRLARAIGTPPRTVRSATQALIVHRSDVVRLGVSAVLASGAAVEVSSAGSFYDAFRVAASVHPQVVLFDFNPTEGAEACRLFGGLWPRPRLVALVSRGLGVAARDCFAAGADGAIAVDNVDRDTFLTSVRRIVDGVDLVAAGFSAVGDAAFVGDPAMGPTAILTPREREMLYLIGEGLSNREIAESLVLSIKTVEAHRANLSRKLNVRSRAGLMRLALTGSLA